MRKFVKPAHPGALIPDPDRGGFLPQDGISSTGTTIGYGI